jgi:hypothetical protein
VGESSAGRAPRFVFLCDAPAAEPAVGRYGWRLVAANHRPLGRGRTASGSLDACRASAQLLHRRVAEMQSVLTYQNGLWTWQLSLGAEPVAVSVHPYMRRIECARGLSQFLAAARVADPDDGVVRHFGPHSLRGFIIGNRQREVVL